MQEGQHDVLTEAIARNWAVVISLPSAGMLRHHKSRFLSAETSADGEGICEGIWLECPPDLPLVDELIATKKPAGVSFKGGKSKVVFTAAVLKRVNEYRLNADTVVGAVLIQRPKEVKEVQRRAAYRVQVNKDTDLHARLWRIAPTALLEKMPMAAQELPAQLHDVSIGGLGLTIKGSGQGGELKLVAEDRVRITLEYQGQTLLLEGALCHKGSAAGERWGVMFKGLQDDLEGRQKLATLNRIVGELQREELRRMRLGLTG